MKVGSSVKGYSIGDRVGILMFFDTCGWLFYAIERIELTKYLGTCNDCFSGEHRFCSTKKILGFAESWGGFSEYALADPISTIKLPEGLSFDVYVILTPTLYHNF